VRITSARAVLLPGSHNRALFVFDLRRNLAGVLGKKGTKIVVFGRAVDRDRRVNRDRWQPEPARFIQRNNCFRSFLGN